MSVDYMKEIPHTASLSEAPYTGRLYIFNLDTTPSFPAEDAKVVEVLIEPVFLAWRRGFTGEDVVRVFDDQRAFAGQISKEIYESLLEKLQEIFGSVKQFVRR